MNGKSRAWALALLASVFVLGGLSGAAIDRTLIGGDREVSSGQRERSTDSSRRRSYLDWLAAQLELTEEQKTEVQGILERHRQQMEDLWRQLRPRYEELQEQARAEIRALLTKEQAAAYDALLERQRQREHDRRRENSRENNGEEQN